MEKRVLKPNGVNAALWALAGFDPALEHFAALRRELMISGKPVDQVDRAMVVYLNDMNGELRAAAGSREGLYEYTQLLHAKFGKALQDATYWMVALAGKDAELGVTIAAYAAALTMHTAHGDGPWNRFYDTVRDVFFEVHPKLRDLA